MAPTSSRRGGGCPGSPTDEAEMIRRLPTVRDVNIGEYTRGPVGAENVNLSSVAIAGFSPTYLKVNGGDIIAGTELHPGGVRSGCPRGRHQRQARPVAVPRAGPDRQDHQDLRRAVPGDRPARGGRLAVQQRRPAAPRHPAHGLRQGGRLRAGLDGDRGGADGLGDDARGPGRGHRGHAQRARAPPGRSQQLRRSSPRTGCSRRSTRSLPGSSW